jgi:hypothetical protein
MTPAELLAQLHEQKIDISVRNDKLVVRGLKSDVSRPKAGAAFAGSQRKSDRVYKK